MSSGQYEFIGEPDRRATPPKIASRRGRYGKGDRGREREKRGKKRWETLAVAIPPRRSPLAPRVETMNRSWEPAAER